MLHNAVNNGLIIIYRMVKRKRNENTTQQTSMLQFFATSDRPQHTNTPNIDMKGPKKLYAEQLKKRIEELEEQGTGLMVSHQITGNQIEMIAGTTITDAEDSPNEASTSRSNVLGTLSKCTPIAPLSGTLACTRAFSLDATQNETINTSNAEPQVDIYSFLCIRNRNYCFKLLILNRLTTSMRTP